MRKIIIDTDIGDDIDDAFALLTALACDNDDLLGVTTVYKNTPQRARIAKCLLQAAGRGEIPVFAGHDHPLKEEIVRWPYEQLGKDGKINIHHYRDFMENTVIEQGKAEDFILETAAKYPGEVTLIAIGPFTNLAKAIQKDREGFLRLKEAYVMAGHPTLPYPEWNIRVDPEAADIFFRSGLPIHCVGLNVTTHCKLYAEQIAKVRAFRSPAVRLAADMMDIWIESNNPQGGISRFPTMHDPLCVLASQYEDVCKFERSEFSVCLSGKERSYLVQDGKGTPMEIAAEVDTGGFYRRFFQAIGSYEIGEEETG